MELIIKEGQIQSAIEHFPEVYFWSKQWLSDKSIFEFTTSGTTGEPKELIFSREQLMASAQRTCDFFQLSSGAKVLHRLPMSFVAGKMNIVRALIMGHSVWAEQPSMHFNDNWNPGKIIWDWWTTTPAMFTAFLETGLDPNYFRKILLGGGKVQPHWQALLSNYSGVCYESYGATETLTHVAVREVFPQSSLFKPLSGVSIVQDENGLKIADDVTHVDVSLNDVLEFKGDHGFEVLGRLDDVINSGGVKIHPLAVESILLPHTSLPFYITHSQDNKWGSVVTIVVKDSDLPHWNEINWQAIFCDHAIWKPKKIIAVTNIDRNENGKIVRKNNPIGVVNSIQ